VNEHTLVLARVHQ